MEYNPTQPKYLQIMESIKIDIMRGVLSSGERVASVRNMALIYDVNSLIIHEINNEISGRLLNEFVDGMQGLGYRNHEIINIVREEMEE